MIPLRPLALTLGAIFLAFGLASMVPQAVADQQLIELPDDDGLSLPALSDDQHRERLQSLRRKEDEAGRDASAEKVDYWITPLRILDMGQMQSGAIARVSGEREVVNFSLYAVEGMERHVLRLTTVSGIHNLPERSHMRVFVNDTEVATRDLTHIEDFGSDDFVLPPDLLRAGRNDVRVEFRQHHRIFCGPEPSFDLWTDIDLARSGLVVDHDATGADAESFIMALAAQAAGDRMVEIRGLSTLGQEKGKWRDFLVRRFNSALAGAPIVFAFPDHWTLAADTPARARVTVLPAHESRVSFRTGGDGAIVLTLEVAQGTDPADLFDDLEALDPAPHQRSVTQITPLEPASFASFGVPTEIFAQRYAVRSYPFRLPSDWLVLTAAKARINLDYAYARNLPEGAMLLLQVNGTTVRLLPLRDEGGTAITSFPVDFEARLMHPGVNLLTFEMFVPGDPDDLPCPGGDDPFLRISDSSTLEVPYSPSMSIPDMSVAFSALAPDSLRVNELSARAFSQTDVTTLSAAFVRDRAEIRPATLHLISMEDLGAIPVASHRPDRRLLENVVLPPESDETNAQSVAQRPDDPFHAPRQQGQNVALAFSAGWTYLTDRAERFFNRVFPHSGDPLNDWLADQRGQAVLFQLDPDRPQEIWMLRGPDTDIHAISHAISSVRGFGGGPRGQVSVLDHQGHWQNWQAPDIRPALLEPWSRENFRYALGNFVSARPIFFTIMMLGMAMLSALVALRLVISTREKT
ncbi:MAG: hypothetical protein EA386_04570 [Rhodobacteraceae bacterium]|nr:MAG: hypothetical protein EA386_04570 [Paracoccaceae bacterium]